MKLVKQGFCFLGIVTAKLRVLSNATEALSCHLLMSIAHWRKDYDDYPNW